MKKFFEIISKIIISLLVAATIWAGGIAFSNLGDEYNYLLIIIAIILIVISVVCMIFGALGACSKRCKTKNKSKEENEEKVQDSKVVEMPKTEVAEGITLFEVLFYIISVFFICWFVNIFSETTVVFAKLELMKMHLIWLGIYDAFLLLSVRTSKIKSSRLIFIYTLIHSLFIINIIFNTPGSMPVAKNVKEEVYLQNLPKFQVFEVITFFAIYPLLKFFRKTKEELPKEKASQE